MYCSGCEAWNGLRCAAYPDIPLRNVLRRKIFCSRYQPAEDRGVVLSLVEIDNTLSPWASKLLLIALIILIILWLLFRVALIPIRWLLRGIRFVARGIFRGIRWCVVGIRHCTRRLAERVRRVFARMREGVERMRRVSEAVRTAVAGPPAAEPPPDLDEYTRGLATELETVRHEAEQVRAELQDRLRAELLDREALRAEMEARLNELEDRRLQTQQKLHDVTERARALGRLARQQQEILDGKARSVRKLAVGKRRLGKRLKEAADLLPEDVLISPKDALHVEHLLQVAEAELEERDQELVRVRADLDDALTELEIYDQQLAIAEQRALDLAEVGAGKQPEVQAEEPVVPLPGRIGSTDIHSSRRFTKEFENLPGYLRPFVAVRLRLLLEQPDRLEHRTFLVDEPDRVSYNLPRKEGLRKCRLNVKYRLFLIPRGQTVELVSVAKHA